MNVALLFPGQGSQKAGMLHQLPDHPAARSVLQEMTSVLGYDVLTLDSEAALRSTVAAQLALLASGVATARALMESGLKPLVVAGISVGTYSAAVAAKAISLSAATRLVDLRGRQMEKLFPAGYGMAAVIGLTEMQITTLVKGVYTDANPVFVANINAPRQIVIAGSMNGMKKVLALALSRGAQKAEILDVAVPSHCLLMEPIAQSLRSQLQTIDVSAPQIIYIANVNARAVRSADLVRTDLAVNISHGVRWHDSTTVAQELGCTLFLQAPPGHVLVDLARNNLQNVEAYAVTSDGISRIMRLANRP
jgi:malonate decarboxylase epsilon subunit